MADASSARSDHASRNETPRLAIPQLNETRSVFGVCAFSGDPDEPMDQAFALLSILSAAFQTSEILGHDGAIREGVQHDNSFHERRGFIFAEALDGIASLMALSRHMDAVNRIEFSNARLDAEGR